MSERKGSVPAGDVASPDVASADAVGAASRRALDAAGAYDADAAIREARLASGLARRLGRLEDAAGAMVAEGLAHYFRDEATQAAASALDAVRRSAGDADATRAWFVTTLAFVSVGAFDIAAVAAARARSHALASGSSEALARAVSAAGIVASETGQHDEAVARLLEASRLARRHTDAALVMKTAGNLSRIVLERAAAREKAGDAAGARRDRQHARRVLLIATRIPAPAGDHAIVRGHLGEANRRLGDLPAAVAAFDEGLDLLGPEALPWLAVECRVRRAHARLALGDLDGAAADVEVASHLCLDARAAASREECHRLQADLAERLGRRDKSAVFRAYARTARQRREAERELACRHALLLWQRHEAARGAPD